MDKRIDLSIRNGKIPVSQEKKKDINAVCYGGSVRHLKIRIEKENI